MSQILEWRREIWIFWRELARALEEQGQMLVILSPYDAPDGATWPLVLPIPYSIGQYAPDAAAALSADARWQHLLDSDDLYQTFLPPSRRAGRAELASAQAFATAVVTELDPDVVVAWAPPFPGSRMLMGEARRWEIPAFGVELGFLHKTVMVESQDVGFGSDLIAHPVVSSALRAHRPQSDLVSAMRRHHAEMFPLTAAPGRRGTEGPKEVVLVGSCRGFNLAPRASRLIQLGSPWFESFGAAFEALRDALPPSTRLLARPHPADAEGQHFCTKLSADELARDGSIRELVARVDVVAVLGSTRTQFEVLLEQKPLLLLSRSGIWGQGVAYEFNGANLPQVVRRALEREEWAARNASAERVLSFLGQHCLYGYGGAPVARGAADLAAFLGQFRMPGATREDPTPRIERFVSRTAPLLAPYVCEELARGVRAMAPVYEPYVEVQTVATLREAGVVTVVVCGVGAVAQRLARAVDAAGMRVAGFIDPAGATAGSTLAGVAVWAYDAVRLKGPSGVLLATADPQEEAAMRAGLAAGGVPRAVRLVSLRSGLIAGWSAPWHLEAVRAREHGASIEQVAGLLDHALTLSPVSAELAFDAGKAAFARGQTERARALARQAADLRPEWSPPWHLQALCARRCQETPAVVLELMERALSREPAAPAIRFDVALAAFAAGQYDRAEALAEAAALARPDWGRAWHLQARCARRRQAAPEVVFELMERALSCEPADPAICLDVAFAAFAVGRCDRAEALAEAAALARPDWGRAWHLQALCARRRQAAPSLAAARLTRAMAAGPVTSQMCLDRALVAIDLGCWDEADRFAARAAALAPDWAAAGALLERIRREHVSAGTLAGARRTRVDGGA